jgi:protoheme ferro-lyase
VFYTRRNTFGLARGNVRSGELSAEVRVLGEEFESPAAQRRAMNIDCRSEKYMDVLCSGFFADGCTDFLEEIHIEGRS